MIYLKNIKILKKFNFKFLITQLKQKKIKTLQNKISNYTSKNSHFAGISTSQ